jgi:serine/threonine protein kinase
VRQAALGLQHALEKGMVHRDIKPHNLMRTPDGQVKILDFGLARFAMETPPAGALLTEAAPAAGASLTQVGTVVGTPDYIAPEQARDAHTADIRADIYSLGCTLYDLLAGQAPFPEGTAVEKVLAHLHQAARPLAEIRPDVPGKLVRVVERMMAKDPVQRYATPAEVAAALAPFCIGWRPRLTSRGRWLKIAAVAGLLLAVGILCGAGVSLVLVLTQGHAP